MIGRDLYRDLVAHVLATHDEGLALAVTVFSEAADVTVQPADVACLLIALGAQMDATIQAAQGTPCPAVEAAQSHHVARVAMLIGRVGAVLAQTAMPGVSVAAVAQDHSPATSC